MKVFYRLYGFVGFLSLSAFVFLMNAGISFAQAPTPVAPDVDAVVGSAANIVDLAYLLDLGIGLAIQFRYVILTIAGISLAALVLRMVRGILASRKAG